MEKKYNFLDQTHKVNFEERDEFYKFRIDDGLEYNVSKVEVESNLVSFKHKGKTYRVFYALEKDQIFLSIDGENYTLQLERDVSSKSKSGKQQKGDSVASPMPGLLVKIPFSAGDKVKAGETLAIVEAMKMQNELPAPRDGIIKKINGKEGEQVDALQVIVELE